MLPRGVQVVDDCLDSSLFEQLLSFAGQPIWAFGWASKPEDRYRYWHAHLTQARSTLDAVQQLVEQRHDAVLDAWNALSRGVLVGFELQACFASAHTFGCGGQFHTDGRPGLHEASAILYAHREWHPEWGGELVFESGAKDPIQPSILPLPNRLVIQPPDIAHAVRTPSRECPALRVSLVFRLKRRDG